MEEEEANQKRRIGVLFQAQFNKIFFVTDRNEALMLPIKVLKVVL